MTPGIYRGVIQRHQWVQSQANPDNLGLQIWVSLVDHITNQEDTIPGTIWFSDKSMGMARRSLKEIGFDPDSQHIKDIGGAVEIVGREVDCIVEEKNGRASISKFGKGGGIKPTADAFDRMQKGLASAEKPKAEKFDDLPEGFFDAEGTPKF